jgi:hypothetical protein
LIACISRPIVLSGNLNMVKSYVLRLVFVFSALATAFSETSCWAGLINGSFENPVVPAGVHALSFAPGGYTLSGWLPSVIEIVNSEWPSYEGKQHLEFDGSGSSLVGTITNLNPGWEYAITFAMAAHPSRTGAYGLSLLVMDNSPNATPNSDPRNPSIPPLARGSFATSTSNEQIGTVRWQQHSLSFVASHTYAQIRFQRSDGWLSGRGPFLDDVGVEVIRVPEPSALTMTALAATVLCGFYRTARKHCRGSGHG